MPFVTIYRKPEYPPLLALGWHAYTMEELRVLCVDGFSGSPTRERIMDCLEHVVDTLLSVGIVGKLWVDGSFLTRKIDADDSDVILLLDGAFADNLNPDQQEVINWFSDASGTLHRWLKCHAFCIARWPEGHPNHESGEWNYAYWLRQWGFSQSDRSKGIAVVELI